MDKIPIRHLPETQKEPGLSGSFSIRDIQELLAEKDMVQELHRHDFFFILILKSGTGYHEIDFTPYTVCNHSVFLMRPRQVHKLTLKAGSTGYLIQFKNDFFYSQNKLSQQLLGKASNKNFCSLDAETFQKLDTLLMAMLTEYQNKPEGYDEVIKSNLNIFFIELVRHRKNREIGAAAINPYVQEQLDKFLDLLEIHITEHKQVSYYAEQLHLSPYQLNSITKTVMDKTPSELINEHILLESKRQLLATSNQVNQIAYNLGYEDVSYFIRFFKKHIGQSPEAFRHNFT